MEKRLKLILICALIVILWFLAMPYVIKKLHDSGFKDIEYRVEEGIKEDVNILEAKAKRYKGYIKGEYNTEKIKYIQIVLYSRKGEIAGYIYSDLTAKGKVYEQVFDAKDITFAYVTAISKIPEDKLIDGSLENAGKIMKLYEFTENEVGKIIQKFKI